MITETNTCTDLIDLKGKQFQWRHTCLPSAMEVGRLLWRKLATSVGRLVSLGSLIASDPTAIRPDVNINFAMVNLKGIIMRYNISTWPTDQPTDRPFDPLVGGLIDGTFYFRQDERHAWFGSEKNDVDFYRFEPVSLSSSPSGQPWCLQLNYYS